jgi:hypothetical protein
MVSACLHQELFHTMHTHAVHVYTVHAHTAHAPIVHAHVMHTHPVNTYAMQCLFYARINSDMPTVAIGPNLVNRAMPIQLFIKYSAKVGMSQNFTETSHLLPSTEWHPFTLLLTLILTSCKFYLIRMCWVPYMTLTLMLTLTYCCQVKDNFIILQKLSTWTFSIAIQATDNGQKTKRSAFCRSKTSWISAATF